MMIRTATIALLCVASTLSAAHPPTSKSADAIGPRIIRKPNIYLLAAAEAEKAQQERIAAVVSLMSATRPQVEAFVIHEVEKERRRMEKQLSIQTAEPKEYKVMPKKIPGGK